MDSLWPALPVSSSRESVKSFFSSTPSTWPNGLSDWNSYISKFIVTDEKKEDVVGNVKELVRLFGQRKGAGSTCRNLLLFLGFAVVKTSREKKRKNSSCSKIAMYVAARDDLVDTKNGIEAVWSSLQNWLKGESVLSRCKVTNFFIKSFSFSFLIFFVVFGQTARSLCCSSSLVEKFEESRGVFRPGIPFLYSRSLFID